ncbi:unnamed protein product, partial [Mesorhabditis belari]|uniref:Sugar transporter SWEET n=1 Tax=Mesorhabditis belari TaxID=2138241 RepID=A0AAF3FD46_9BILA
MDLFSIYAIWLIAFSIVFTFLPIFAVLEWKKRGTADGFSSVNLVLPCLMMICWLRHGLMTGDKMNIYLNLFNLFFFSGYIFAFGYFQPKRQYLIAQIIGLITLVYGIFNYVDKHDADEAPEVMGAFAAGTQIFGLLGGLYEIKRAISFKHTEYMPAILQFAIWLLTLQWLIFGIWAGNQFIAIANVAGIIVNTIPIILYFIYPPLTWRVPIIGTGPQQKKKE